MERCVTFPWIVYSASCDGIFCKQCVFFAKLKGPVGSFIKTPVKNWTKALGECKAHDRMSHHQTALKMSEDFLSTYKNPTTAVDVRGQSAMVCRINANREILKSIASTVLFCGRQNIALRGHRDDASSNDEGINRGNFHELLQFRINAGDTALEKHLQTASRRATYISKTIQNQLIGIIGDQIRDHILDEVRKARFFSILADEVTNSSNWEQLSLVVRYVDTANTIKEQFLCFLNCESVTGEAMTKRICDTLQDLDLPIENLRGQVYDGGSNMAGHVNGVQGRITAINDKAIYVHCAAHCLTLSIVKACQIQVMRNMLGTLKEICFFFNASPKRQRHLEKIINMEAPLNKKTKLVDLCKTRWIERHVALETFSELYPVVVSCLEDMVDTSKMWDSETLVKTRGFLACLLNFEFLVAFIVMKNCLRYLKPVTVNVQQRSKDIIQSYGEISQVKECLQDVRKDDESYFEVWYQEALYLAERLDIEPKIPRVCKRQTMRSNMPSTSVPQYYRRTILIPFLDHITSELDTRFSRHSQLIVDGLQLTPDVVAEKPNGALPSGIQSLVDCYSEDLPSPDNVQCEYHRWWRRWHDEAAPPTTIRDALQVCDAGFYPNLNMLMRILCTIPVTTAECERTISTIRRLKTYLRSTMTNDRLNGLALMAIHYGIQVDINAVVSAFASSHPTRMKFDTVDFLHKN